MQSATPCWVHSPGQNDEGQRLHPVRFVLDFCGTGIKAASLSKRIKTHFNEEIVNSNKTFLFLATMYFQIMYAVLVESNIRYIAFGNIALTSVLGKQSSKTPSTKANTGPCIIADIPTEVHAPFKIRVNYKFRNSYCGVKITSYDRTLTTMGFPVSGRLIYY